MTTARRHRVLCSLAGMGLAAAQAGFTAARAQQAAGLDMIKGGSTPKAINGVQILERTCPLLVSPADAALQPLRIDPSQVAAKNALGCLSSADAIYGADGCPTKLCGAGRGVIPLPAGISPATPPLPAP
jgi:hypothetical protein